jgi:hypothetical protein
MPTHPPIERRTPFCHERNSAMRMSLILPVATALAVAAIGISSPASTTTLKEALKICNKHGNCRVNNGSGGANIQVGTNEVYCPHGGGQCQCVVCTPPKRTQSVGTGKFGLGSVLNQSPSKTSPREVLTSPSGGGGSWTSTGGVFAPKSGGTVQKTRHKPEPKPVPTAEPKPAPKTKSGSWTTTTTIPAKPTVRDHRATPKVGDDRSSPGVKTTRYPYDAGTSDSGRNGPSKKRLPEIRDHRGADPASRDDASETRKPKIIDHRSSGARSSSSNVPPKSAGSGGTNCGTQGNPRCVAQ